MNEPPMRICSESAVFPVEVLRLSEEELNNLDRAIKEAAPPTAALKRAFRRHRR